MVILLVIKEITSAMTYIRLICFPGLLIDVCTDKGNVAISCPF